MQPEFPPVLTKRDFVRRYALGEFGNSSPTWKTFTEFNRYVAETYGNVDIECESPQRYHLRNRAAQGVTHYDLHYVEAWSKWLKLCQHGTDWYCSQMAPTHLTLINGEAIQSETGLQLYYSTVKKPMRDSLREGGRQATGLVALEILKWAMNARSYEWLQVLLDRYPFHVVEFSCYSKCWGTIPHYNTTFWEVRYGY